MAFSNQSRGTLMVVVAVTLISVEGLLVRQISADRWSLICWRGVLMFMSLTLWLIVCWRSQTPSKFRLIGIPGLVAAIILGGSNILFVSAFTLTSIANTLVLVNSAPLLVALLSWLILREKVPGRSWIAIVAGLAGVAVIFHGSLTGGSLIGDLCALGAAGSFAAYLIFLRYARNVNMIPSLALSGLFTALFVLPVAHPLVISRMDLSIVILIGGIILPVGLGLITRAPSYIPATEVGLIMLLEAVLGTAWAWIFLAEVPGAESLLGGVLVIGALTFNSLGRCNFKRDI